MTSISSTSGKSHITFLDWLKDKRGRDNIGSYWRIHDKLYDLSHFVSIHPGGEDWIEITQGTDITEAFETSHMVNIDRVERILRNYYVKDARGPRASPYLFKNDGFYKTLKRRVEPILKSVGTSPSRKFLFMQDSLVFSYLILSLLGAWTASQGIQAVAGLVLGLAMVGAHNFVHLKDTWRRFYFDLGPLTSYELRITHALSHHLYPNTSLDYEVTGLQPGIEFLPSRRKNWLQKYGPIIYCHFLALLPPADVLKRAYLIYAKKMELRWEHLLNIGQYFCFTLVSPSLLDAGLCYLIIQIAASYWFAVVTLHGAHHHPACFHDGDERRKDPDFGLCQLDATIDRTDHIFKSDFMVLTTFGEHPLHHLFPTVCHSKLGFVKPVVETVLKEFMERNRATSQLDLALGTQKQFSRTQGWSHRRQKQYQFSV